MSAALISCGDKPKQYDPLRIRIYEPPADLDSYVIGVSARDQAGLTAVAQETADLHDRIELVLGEP